ncbi:hypothetical protein [Spirillospora sp. NPDC047279]|uniref:hypothetical protein n=1 Tax=Spirillospora sp. NPDC047279 TaxID=3155478 RepID=UPI0033C9661F
MSRRALVIVLAAGSLVLPATAQAAAGLTISADRARLGSPTTDVRLSGHYSCGPFTSGLPDRGVLDLEVLQTRNGQTARAIGYLEPSVCDGTARTFSVTLTGYGARFVRGAATWSASGYVEGDGGLQHVHVPPTPITITR